MPCDNGPGCQEEAPGHACYCDPECKPEHHCGCDTSPDTCDTASGGDVCFCDPNCQPSCPCDDGDPNTCATDSDGNMCHCDPSCQPQDCYCDSGPPATWIPMAKCVSAIMTAVPLRPVVATRPRALVTRPRAGICATVTNPVTHALATTRFPIPVPRTATGTNATVTRRAIAPVNAIARRRVTSTRTVHSATAIRLVTGPPAVQPAVAMFRQNATSIP